MKSVTSRPDESESQTGPLEFDALYREHQSSVFRFAYYLTQNQGEAEDLFQETWLRVVQNLSRISDMSTFKAWVFAIAANLHRDALRKKRVQRLFFLQKSKASGEESRISGGSAEREPSSKPDELEHVDLGVAISRAMARLPERQRLVFILKEAEGFKHSEISEMLKIPANTVKTLMFRAVRRLQRDLAVYQPNHFSGERKYEMHRH